MNISFSIFIENEAITNGRTKMKAITECVFYIGFISLHVFNTWLSHGEKHSRYLYGNYHLVESIVMFCKKSYMCLFGYYVSLEMRGCVFNLIDCFIWGSKRWEI